MRYLSLIIVALLLTSCTRATLDRRMDRAYQAYNQGHCQQVMLELSRAERLSRSRAYLQPEISLLRGQCLERQKLYLDASQTYLFIIEQYPRSEYAFRAQARLDTLRQLGHFKASSK